MREVAFGSEQRQLAVDAKLREQRVNRADLDPAPLAEFLADAVMAVVTDRDGGLFPGPKEFQPSCSCPDMVPVCKHVAAVFYGVGVRLDARPELLFELRGVDHHALVADDAGAVAALTARGDSARIAESDLGDVFGIDLDDEADPVQAVSAPASPVGVARSARRDVQGCS